MVDEVDEDYHEEKGGDPHPRVDPVGVYPIRDDQGCGSQLIGGDNGIF